MQFVARLVASALLVVVARPQIADARQPNVIILMPDQMRGQAMSLAGNDQVVTPNLERLAQGGLYLPNTFANNPVCCPARATILTGMYAHRHGMIVNDLRLREDVTTLAELFADAGYATGFIGKWHLDGGHRMPGFIPPGPRRQGFQFWAANQCNHQHARSVYFRDTPEPINMDRFETEVWTDEAIRFIEANRDKPFYLWWTCGPPHNPYKAPERFGKMYDPAKLTMRPNWKDGTRFGSSEQIANYYAMITDLDEQIGRMLDLLDKLGLADDTVVLFTSDHGDMLGSHGSIFKCKPWEESIRVPGIVRYPRRIPAGQIRDTLFSHVDILPTLLTFCGISVPDQVQGRDLSGLLAAPTPSAVNRDEPDAVYLQIFEPRVSNHIPAGWRGIRTKRFTYARLADGPWMLYDNREDPNQLRNLAGKPDHESLQARLDQVLTDRMKRTGDSWSYDLKKEVPFYRGKAVYEPADFVPDPSAKPTR